MSTRKPKPSPSNRSGATAFDDDLDFKFLDPSNYEDGTGSKAIAAERKQELVNEAIGLAVQAWHTRIAAEHDQAIAEAMGQIPPPPEPLSGLDADDAEDDGSPGVEDEHAEARSRQERLLLGAEGALEQSEQLRRSYERKRARLASAGVTIAPSDVKEAKRQFLLGTGGDGQSGYMLQLEQEFINHRQRRRRDLAALGIKGALELNETERAARERQVIESERAMDLLRGLIVSYRDELKTLGGKQAADKQTSTQSPDDAGLVTELRPPRAQRRAKK